MGTASLAVESSTKICTAINLSSRILAANENSCDSSGNDTPADDGFISISGLVTNNVSSFIGKIKGTSGSAEISYDMINESTVRLEYNLVTLTGSLA